MQISKDEKGLLSVTAVLNKIKREVKPLDKFEAKPLLEALHLKLAEDILAPISLPSFHNSAVDGYAINFDDAHLKRLPLKDRVIAGDKEITHAKGTATRIFTGAPMPLGADTVYMQEDVRVENGFVLLPDGLKHGANARPVGEDIEKGEVAVHKRQSLTPRHIALLSALGVTEVKIYAPLKVGVFSTGNEIISPPSSLESGKIYDANRFLLMALIKELNLEPIDLGILPDNEAKIKAALLRASENCDILLTSGGVSMGEEDYVKLAVENVSFWKVGIKPGRPVMMGEVGKAKVIGLPGNPVAVFITFTYLVKPLISAMRGEKYNKPKAKSVELGFDYKKKEGRREYVRVTLQNGIAHKYPQDGAGVITSLTKTDGLLELEEKRTVLKKGESVRFIAYNLL